MAKPLNRCLKIAWLSYFVIFRRTDIEIRKYKWSVYETWEKKFVETIVCANTFANHFTSINVKQKYLNTNEERDLVDF